MTVLSALIIVSLLILLTILIYALRSIYIKEKKLWNYGYCKKCNKPWELVEIIPQGLKVYRCPKCYEYLAITTEIDTMKRKKTRCFH